MFEVGKNSFQNYLNYRKTAMGQKNDASVAAKTQTDNNILNWIIYIFFFFRYKWTIMSFVFYYCQINYKNSNNASFYNNNKEKEN